MFTKLQSVQIHINIPMYTVYSSNGLFSITVWIAMFRKLSTDSCRILMYTVYSTSKSKQFRTDASDSDPRRATAFAAATCPPVNAPHDISRAPARPPKSIQIPVFQWPRRPWPHRFDRTLTLNTIPALLFRQVGIALAQSLQLLASG
jgi:hypothetical protein